MFQDMLLLERFQRTYLILLFSFKSTRKFSHQNLHVREKALNLRRHAYSNILLYKYRESFEACSENFIEKVVHLF